VSGKNSATKSSIKAATVDGDGTVESKGKQGNCGRGCKGKKVDDLAESTKQRKEMTEKLLMRTLTKSEFFKLWNAQLKKKPESAFAAMKTFVAFLAITPQALMMPEVKNYEKSLTTPVLTNRPFLDRLHDCMLNHFKADKFCRVNANEMNPYDLVPDNMQQYPHLFDQIIVRSDLPTTIEQSDAPTTSSHVIEQSDKGD
jgi:hypothetical protein